MAFDIEMIKKVYDNMATRVDKAREIVGRPLTLTEKILYSHLWDGTCHQKHLVEVLIMLTLLQIE
jgi:aconitate hydratase